MPVKEQPYDIGDDVQLTGTVTDAVDALADPGTLTLTIDCPDGATVTKTIPDFSHPSTGLYRYTYRVANGSGVYSVTWTAGGVLGVVGRDSFRVRKPAA